MSIGARLPPVSAPKLPIGIGSGLSGSCEGLPNAMAADMIRNSNANDFFMFSFLPKIVNVPSANKKTSKDDLTTTHNTNGPRSGWKALFY